MGIQKQKWTEEETAALKAGVEKHGPGKWKNILIDPDFSDALTNRSNIDLKDKWRNLGIANIPLASENKDPVLSVTRGSHATPQKTNDALSLVAASGATNTPKNPEDGGIIITRSIVFEAISSIDDSKGADFNAIASFIEKKQEVPFNFRRYLSSMIGRLTQQRRLEKVEQCYKITDAGPSTKTTRRRSRNLIPRAFENIDVSKPDTPEAAVGNAAFLLAEAENKFFLAAEAVEEAERVDAMVAESEEMLEAVKVFCKQYNL